MADNKKYSPGRITHAVWELTLMCNMRCLHCGSYAGSPRKDELSLERCLDLVDEMVDLGLQRITLSGGEPFLRKGWDVIAERLIKKGVLVGVISNGWFVEKNLDKIKKLKDFDVIAMSLDGLRETHDTFRRTPGSYDRILRAFLQLKKIGIRTASITCVSKYNIHQLDTIHDVLQSHGVYAWQVQPIFVGGRTREYEDMVLPTRDLYRVAKFLSRKMRVSPMNVFPADGVGYYSRFEKVIRPDGWPGCQAGLCAIGIEANGNIKGCLSLYPEAQEDNPFVEGNVKEKSLREIWEDPEAFAYNRQFDPQKAEGFCKTCQYLEECRCGCSAEAFSLTRTTYNNPYCLYREVTENGVPEDENKVPTTPEFQQKLKKFYKEQKARRRRKRTLPGKPPGFKPPHKIRVYPMF